MNKTPETQDLEFAELKSEQIKREWWEGDYTELLTILCMTAIAIMAIVVLKVKGTEIASAVVGGFAGYLVRAVRDAMNK